MAYGLEINEQESAQLLTAEDAAQVSNYWKKIKKNLRLYEEDSFARFLEDEQHYLDWVCRDVLKIIDIYKQSGHLDLAATIAINMVKHCGEKSYSAHVFMILQSIGVQVRSVDVLADKVTFLEQISKSLRGRWLEACDYERAQTYAQLGKVSEAVLAFKRFSEAVAEKALYLPGIAQVLAHNFLEFHRREAFQLQVAKIPALKKQMASTPFATFLHHPEGLDSIKLLFDL